ncbi:hypothetical protein BDD26_2849 [Xenorhabdus cabanillasii]|uniref:Uncharacterized protein n=1 Tax=Xenorhabdus cabanillasii TaxID=351673 RepID=A0A3D9UFF4_9GAMM|nr:hypothetical protein Xcab_00013 [Xenorhabdus cabanillasii JM26]REF27996.1 hypothetical protein BDD26_2849 [Xenorhabdus cabanillasii]
MSGTRDSFRYSIFKYSGLRKHLSLRNMSSSSLLFSSVKYQKEPELHYRVEGYGIIANERTGNPAAFSGLATILKITAPRVGT